MQFSKQNALGRPTLFANNWDRFGGRALDILNCFYLSQKLQINFAFFWPFNSFFSKDDPHLKFFSQNFLETYRVYKDVDSTAKQSINFNEYTFTEAKEYVGALDENSTLGIANFFDLPLFLDDIEGDCVNEYANCAQSVMSTEVRDAFEEIKDTKTNWITIHGRYGDLIDGAFKQYVPQSKFVNTLAYRMFLQQKMNRSKEICFLSDSSLVVKGLEQLTNRSLSYQYLSRPLQKTFDNEFRDFQDLLIMANSEKILAPNSSAYSILASRIGGVSILDYQSSLNERQSIKLSDREIKKHYKFFDAQISGALMARDLVNLMQNHGGFLSFRKVWKLSGSAYAADSGYVYAACIWSALQMMIGNVELAFQILAGAEERARSVTSVHFDPLAVVLLTKACISRFEIGLVSATTLQELTNLKTYQFSTVYALDYLTKWNHKWEAKQNHHQSSFVLRLVKLINRQFIRIIPRKLRLSRSWKKSQKNITDEFLFSILDLFFVI